MRRIITALTLLTALWAGPTLAQYVLQAQIDADISPKVLTSNPAER
jgi:hypothetical protein